MADFCRWGYAIAEALGIKGSRFLGAYWESIERQNEVAIENHPVACAITVLLKEQPSWVGRPSDLLGDLERIAEQEKIDKKANSWPKAAHILTRRIKEVKSNLLESGIEFIESRSGHERFITLQRVSQNSVTTVTSVTEDDATDADDATLL